MLNMLNCAVQCQWTTHTQTHLSSKYLQYWQLCGLFAFRRNGKTKDTNGKTSEDGQDEDEDAEDEFEDAYDQEEEEEEDDNDGTA